MSLMHIYLIGVILILTKVIQLVIEILSGKELSSILSLTLFGFVGGGLGIFIVAFILRGINIWMIIPIAIISFICIVKLAELELIKIVDSMNPLKRNN